MTDTRWATLTHGATAGGWMRQTVARGLMGMGGGLLWTCPGLVEGDGKHELVTWDGTFMCWRACCACSAAPQLVLRLHEGGFRPAFDLMRKPASPRADLDTQVGRIARAPRDGDSGIPVALWQGMLNLIYAGDAPSAWELFHLAWPRGVQGQDRFLVEFRAQLQKSPYWEGVVEANGERVW